MEKFYINASMHKKGDLLGGWKTIQLPATKQEIEETAKSLGYVDVADIYMYIHYETNLPKEYTNYIDYGCFITEDGGNRLINTGHRYTSYERLKFYNTLAICLNDLYNSDYGEDSITRFIYAYAEHSAIIISSEKVLEVHYPDDYEYDEYDENGEYIDDDNEEGLEVVETFKHICAAFLTEGTANLLEGYYGFLDYSNLDGDFYVLGAWDIDEFEGETIEDYDDDPVEYLEALSESYDLYINEYERYILNTYYESKEAEEKYSKRLDDRLIELGY